MERYLLFAFDQYYPRGGWDDFRGSFKTLEEAMEAWDDMTRDWGQIVDIETEEIRHLHSTSWV